MLVTGISFLYTSKHSVDLVTSFLFSILFFLIAYNEFNGLLSRTEPSADSPSLWVTASESRKDLDDDVIFVLFPSLLSLSVDSPPHIWNDTQKESSEYPDKARYQFVDCWYESP